jgi:ribonuclease G
MEGGRLLELKHETEEDVVGNIYLAKVTDVVPGLDACFVHAGIERNAFLHVSDAMPEEPPRGDRRAGKLPRIQDVVSSGDEFLVQVTKGPLDTKGARATRHISLPGRYLVLTTDGDKVGVSKKIEDDPERKRLREMVGKLRPEGFGLIVRTRAEGARQEDFEHDIRFLTKVWRSLENKAKQSKAPALIHNDVSLVFAVVRDVLTADFDKFIVDDKVTYDQVLNLLQQTAPHLRKKVEFYRGPEPIFDHYNVEQEIERALNSKVLLQHGGHLNIETTVALTTIDVNSGKFTGTSSLSETVLKTNLDACAEVARQLRLRDIGGIIVIDFIDMDKPNHRKQVTAALRTAFAEDRMRTRIMHITRLGLVEMTRKRTGESLLARLQTKCPCCAGSGHILAPETVAQRAINTLRARVAKEKAQAAHILADPQCILALIGEHGEEVEALQKELGIPIYARATYETHPEDCILTLGEPEAFEKQYGNHKVGEIIEVKPSDALPGQHGALLALVEGWVVEIPEFSSKIEKVSKVRLTRVENSYMRGTPAKAQKR